MKTLPSASSIIESSEFFQPPHPHVFFKKNDPQDQRLGNFSVDTFQSPSSTEETLSTFQLAILGYPDDEGIRMNGGRPGACEGPDAIRKSFYKMTPAWEKKFQILDGGNLDLTKKISLRERHETARKRAQSLLMKNIPLLSFGGGHDYGFPDASAFLEACKVHHPHQKPLVINFDAHLDVRPFDQDPHSGTPFRRLLERYRDEFYFVEIGLQPHCNSLHHKNWLLDQGGFYIGIETLEIEGLENQLEKIRKDIGLSAGEKRPLWVSLDIDVFHQNEAPGCSQSWPRGLTFKETLPFFQKLFSSFEMKGLGIYEVSPPLDSDSRTSKLAALFAYEFLRLQMVR